MYGGVQGMLKNVEKKSKVLPAVVKMHRENGARMYSNVIKYLRTGDEERVGR